MPGGNHYGANSTGRKQKYRTKLAVSVITRALHQWTNINIEECLNRKLRSNPADPSPVVICERHKHGQDNEYYVELRTQDDREALLELNGTRVESGGHCVWLSIESWDRMPSLSPSSRELDRYSNNDSSKQRQHQQQKDGTKIDRGYLNEISGRGTYNDNSDDRPSKRQKIPAPPLRKNNKNASVFVSTNRSKKRSVPTSVSHSPIPRHGEKTSNTNIQKSSTDMVNCTIFLTKKPDQYTPESFQKYLNSHLRETSMIGLTDDEDGENSSSKPPICNCYESSASNIYGGWVLETKTEKIADEIINNLSGKLILSGTRLYFQRHSNFSKGGSSISPLSPSTHSPSVQDTNDRQFLSSSLPSWKDEECFAYMSKIPISMSLEEVSSFVNSFMRKAGLFDRDVIIDARLVGKNNACVFLCSSTDAAQSIIDELNDVSLKNNTLKFRRHKNMKEQGQTAYDKADDENLKKGMAPSTKARTLPRDEALDPPPSLGKISSKNPVSTSRCNEESRNTDALNRSRFLFLSFRKKNTINLPKVMSFLDETITDESYVDRSPIVGAERYSSFRYRLETDEVETASKLVKLSGIVYNGTIELILTKDENDNSKLPPSTTAIPSNCVDRGTQVGHQISMLANAEDSGKLKEKNNNLTKQVMKLLKENKDLKKQKDNLVRASLVVKTVQIGSGSHRQPIQLEDASDEENVKKTASQKHEKEKYDELKRKFKTVVSELEKIKVEKNHFEKDLFIVKDTCKEFERQVEEAKKEVNDDYEQRLYEIHESWREQNTRIQEQQDLIESLKVGQDQEAIEKERLNSQLEEQKKRYQDMTDALTRSSTVIQEEMAVRKAMAFSLVKFKKAKKRAQKELKAYRSLRSNVKTEDNYDA